MESEKIDNKALAHDIAQEIYRLNYSDYINAEVIALMAGFAPNGSAVRAMMADKTFPESVEFSEGGHKRWNRKAVSAWLGRFDRNNHTVLMSATFGR